MHTYMYCVCVCVQLFHQHYAREKHFAALLHKESVALLQGLGVGQGAMEKVAYMSITVI